MSVLVDRTGTRAYHKRVFEGIEYFLVDGPARAHSGTHPSVKEGQFLGIINIRKFDSDSSERRRVLSITFTGEDKEVVKCETLKMFKKIIDFSSSRKQLLNLSEMSFECDCKCSDDDTDDDDTEG